MIGKKRQERLLEHLKLLAELTGKPLRTSPRFSESLSFISCPIEDFAPDEDKDGLPFFRGSEWGDVFYSRLHLRAKQTYRAYGHSDSVWWENLRLKTQREITRWLETQIPAINTEVRNANKGGNKCLD